MSYMEAGVFIREVVMQSKFILTVLAGAAFAFTGCSAAEEAVNKTKDAAEATADKAGEMASDAKDGMKAAADKTGKQPLAKSWIRPVKPWRKRATAWKKLAKP